MPLSSSLFGQKFALTERDLEGYLAEALSKGGDYADLYFEYLATASISLDESIIKSATQGVTLGVGIRVLSGERQAATEAAPLNLAKVHRGLHKSSAAGEYTIPNPDSRVPIVELLKISLRSRNVPVVPVEGGMSEDSQKNYAFVALQLCCATIGSCQT